MARTRLIVRKYGWMAVVAAVATLNGGGCQLMLHDAFVGASESTFLSLLNPCNIDIPLLSANCPTESPDMAGG
ncbi:MAG: hypothetical protein HOP29_02890 [Phycisphaerales bacterium]|nr:hypothetical protein [Phycisphaerales bacterium]